MRGLEGPTDLSTASKVMRHVIANIFEFGVWMLVMRERTPRAPTFRGGHGRVIATIPSLPVPPVIVPGFGRDRTTGGGQTLAPSVS